MYEHFQFIHLKFAYLVVRFWGDLKYSGKGIDVGLTCHNVEEIGNVGDQPSRVYTTQRSTDQMHKLKRNVCIQDENKGGLVQSCKRAQAEKPAVSRYIGECGSLQAI